MNDTSTRDAAAGTASMRINWERILRRNQDRATFAEEAPVPTGLHKQSGRPTLTRPQGPPVVGERSGFRPALRLQQSLLTPLEKRALLWLARRMPSWVTPDHLTLVGFAAMILAGACYWLSRWNPNALLAVIFCLAVNWFGDSLDGTLARMRNCQRPRYGFYVDHIIDALGMVCLIGGLALSRYMHLPVALGLLVAYFMVSIEVYLATYTRSLFRLSFLYWGPTELRLLLAIGNIVLLFHPTVTLGSHGFLLCDVGAAITIIALAAVLTVSIVKNTMALYAEERL